jgi:hypothetical protein
MQTSFSRFAGLAGMFTGLFGLLYLIAFLILRDPGAALPSLLLAVSGILGSALLVGLYQRVLAVDAGFALWGWLLAVAGAGGAAIHGAFDLANNLHAPAAAFAYPNPADPRGFLTFGLGGLGTIVLSWLLLRGAILARGAAILGIVSGGLLVALYLAYLVSLDPANPLVVALVVATGLIQPAWNLWVGWLLWQEAGDR